MRFAIQTRGTDRDAGVTDFTLSFADFPSSAMLRLFAEQVLLYLPE